ncbi:NYN domain-containing protein [Suillus variegatus]|nr:NYN domain-containing protein [Suillus variegatus]
MSNNRKVAIFWDYENCSPPLNSQGHAIVNGIRRIAHVFGYVISFKAYFDMSSQSSQKSVGFRSDLQSSGVSIIDCPHNGKKEVVDKMILVDMITFAVDNPSPATVILIAGDRDYAYAISTLRLRQYNVVLVVPPAPNIPQSLESQASVVVDWNFAILGKRTEADTAPSVASRARSATQSTHSVSDLEQGSGSPLKEHKALSNESLADSLVSVANEIQDATRDPFSRTFTSLERNQNSTESGPLPATGSSNFPLSPPPVNTALPLSHTRTISGGTPISYDGKPQNAVPAAVPLSPTVSSRGRSDDITAPSSTNIDLTSAMLDNHAVASDKAALQDAFGIDDEDRDDSSTSDDNEDNPSACQTPPIESVEDKIRRNTPLKFLPLMNRLLLARSKGEMKPSRSTIAAELVQHDKNVYLSAGVTRFAQYTALAEHASLIQLGGREGDAWITLHPNLFRQDIDLDTPQSSSTPSTAHNNNSPTPQDNIPHTTTPSPTPSPSAMPPPTPGPTKPPPLNPNAEPFRAIVPIPLCFRPLITCLAKFHTDGVPKPVRSVVGQGLGLAAYSQAGTSSLKEYLAQAVHAGVVECGGHGGSAWARLHRDVLNGKRSY